MWTNFVVKSICMKRNKFLMWDCWPWVCLLSVFSSWKSSKEHYYITTIRPNEFISLKKRFYLTFLPFLQKQNNYYPRSYCLCHFVLIKCIDDLEVFIWCLNLNANPELIAVTTYIDIFSALLLCQCTFYYTYLLALLCGFDFLYILPKLNLFSLL